MQRSTKREKNI